MYLIGVDPALTATGCVLLAVPEIERPTFPKASDVTLLSRHTITTTPAHPLAERLDHIAFRLTDWLVECVAADISDATAWTVIEDPTDFEQIPGQKRVLRDVAVTGAAYGAAYVALAQEIRRWSVCLRLHSISVKDWLPRERNTRGGTHFTKHLTVRNSIKQRYPALAKCTDHEVFAAGCAIHAYATGRLLPSRKVTS